MSFWLSGLRPLAVAAVMFTVASFAQPPSAASGDSASAPSGPPAPRADADAGEPAAAATTDGALIFKQTCVPCHGPDGAGGAGGGAPLDLVTDVAAAMQTITEGRNQMPAFAGILTDEQIEAVSRYIVEELFE